MNLIEKNWKLILGICGIIILIGGGLATQSALATAHEKKAQEGFFLIEKKYTDYKTKKDAPDQAASKPKDKKAAVAKAVETKPEAKLDSEALAAQLTGIKKELENFIAENSKSKATQMAALYLAEILRQENNKQLALTTLQKVVTGDSGLVNTLVQQQIGQLLADLGKFQEAIDTWQQIINRKEAQFLHDELKIQQALCYQKLNDTKKAEELLTNLANQKVDNPSDTSNVKEAARYLRLIQIKKMTGT